MKKSILIFALGVLIIVGFLAVIPTEFSSASQNQLLRHVVLLDLNEKATDTIIQKMEEDLQDLKENIPQIRELEFGRNIQNNADYSHCMLLTFENTVSLEQYEEHPKHLEFASTYGKYVIKKTEVDYWY